MDVFVVERTDYIDWTEDYKMVVVAVDELHAEKACRMKSRDFKTAKLKITKVDLNYERIISVENTGA